MLVFIRSAKAQDFSFNYINIDDAVHFKLWFRRLRTRVFLDVATQSQSAYVLLSSIFKGCVFL